MRTWVWNELKPAVAATLPDVGSVLGLVGTVSVYMTDRDARLTFSFCPIGVVYTIAKEDQFLGYTSMLLGRKETNNKNNIKEQAIKQLTTGHKIAIQTHNKISKHKN